MDTFKPYNVFGLANVGSNEMVLSLFAFAGKSMFSAVHSYPIPPGQAFTVACAAEIQGDDLPVFDLGFLDGKIRGAQQRCDQIGLLDLLVEMVNELITKTEN